MHFREVLLTIVAIIFSINTVFADSENSVKIALIAEKTSDFDKSPLISMLEVELSQKEGLQMLERAAIDKILEEQKLSAAGLLDRNMTIKIGKLLRADAFIILSLENPVPERSRVNQVQDANDLIRVRVSETAHGLRLLDSFEQSNSKNPQNAVNGIIKKIESILNKINQPDEKLIPVGIVDIHRVQLGEQYKMLERTLPTLLSVRLSLEPQIIMLEREDLKVLLDEKLMTEGEDTEFWSSAILIDGYIQPKNGQLELHLNLKQASGDILKSIIVQVEPNEAVVSIDKASIEIIKKLNSSTPTAKWDSKPEAEQFYKKAQMLFAHGRNDEALPLFETAHALQPQDIYYAATAFGKIWDNHRKYKDIERNVESMVHQYTDLELAEMVSVLVRQIRDNFEEGKLSSSDIYNNFAEYLGKTFGSRYYFSNYASVATQQIKIINRENRNIYCETFRKAVSNQLIDPKRPETNYIALANLAWISSDDPNTIMTNIRKYFYEYVMPPEFGGKIKSFDERENIFMGGFFTNRPMFSSLAMNSSHLKEVSNIFYKSWLNYYLELTKINDLLLSSKGALLLFQEILIITNESDRILAKNIIQNSTERLVDELTNSKSSLGNKEKIIALSYIKKIIQYSDVIDTGNKTIILDKICNYLIELNDINNLVDIVTYLPDFSPSTVEIDNWRYQFMKKILNVLQTYETDVRVKRALVKINNHIENYRNKYLQTDIYSPKTNLSVSILLDQKGWVHNDEYYDAMGIKATVRENILWVALSPSYRKTEKDKNGNLCYLIDILIAGIDLKQKKDVKKRIIPVAVSSESFGSLPSLLIGNKASYLAIHYGGILKFPGNNLINQDVFGNSQFLTQENGLPSSGITSIAQYGDKLFVAYGDSKKESGLGKYDPVTEEWETIFCSTLQGEPPFNSGQTYQITSMLYAKPDKIFLIVSELNKSELWKSQLWKVDINTHESNYIRNISGEFFTDLNNIWIKSSGKLIEFDPVSENMKLSIRTTMDYYRRYPQNIPDISGLDEDLFLPETFLKKVNLGSIYTEGMLDISTGTIHNNKLWARYGKSKIIIAEKGSNFEDATIIDNNILDGKPVYKFVSSPYGVVGIGEGIVGLIETGD